MGEKDENKALQKFKEMRYQAIVATRSNTCFLCGKVLTGSCESHSIPKFILKNIADNGWVFTANKLMKVETERDEKGVNNSGIFRLICDGCDKTFFSEYESSVSLQIEPSPLMMAEIALKNFLLILNWKRVDLELYKNPYFSSENLRAFAKGKQQILQLDIQEIKNEIDFYKQIIVKRDTNQCRFRKMFWKLLPYRTPLAVETAMAIGEDCNGNLVNDVFNYSKDNRIEYVHIGVFPLKESTAVIAFYHVKDKKYRPLLHQLNAQAEEKTLRFLNWLVIKYAANYYISKEMEEVIENNKNLQKLSREESGLPNFGIVNEEELRAGGTGISMNDIPNFLCERYSLDGVHK